MKYFFFNAFYFIIFIIFVCQKNTSVKTHFQLLIYYYITKKRVTLTNRLDYLNTLKTHFNNIE